MTKKKLKKVWKKVWNCKKGVKYEKKNCLKLIENDISMIKNGFLNFCIFQWKLHMLRLSEFSSIFFIIKEIYENEKVTQIKQVVIRYSKITRILTIYFSSIWKHLAIL